MTTPDANAQGANIQPQPTAKDPLTAKETRDIVTPYAFQVAPQLLGTPLATPVRRGVAQLIDLALVAMLSGVSALVLAFFAAITFIKSGSNLALKSSRSFTSKILKASGAVLLFLVTFVVVDSYKTSQIFSDSSPEQQQHAKNIAQPILRGVNKLAWGACNQDFECLREVALEFGQAAGEITDGPLTEQQHIVKDLNQLNLSQEQQTELKTIFEDAFAQAFTSKSNNQQASSESSADADTSAQADNNRNGVTAPNDDNKDITPMQQLMSWVDGIIRDLGLGFGWAALYYSVFTAWFKGSTPGKWAMNIRVVRLDGKSPTLWESFGRYGGYGAGLATGLLGFLQIFWDPNRQAIQDKIAETLVVKVRKEKKE